MRHERGTRTYLGGMIEAGERLGVTLIPTFAASTEPWGTIAGEAYDTMVGELIRGIQKAMPLDAICLGSTGRGSPRGLPIWRAGFWQPSGEPLATRCDRGDAGPPRQHHAQMVSLATGLFGVHEYPHTDAYERGQEAMAFLLRVLQGEVAPVMAIEVLPLLIPASPSALEPARTINALCHQWNDARHGRLRVLPWVLADGCPGGRGDGRRGGGA